MTLAPSTPDRRSSTDGVHFGGVSNYNHRVGLETSAPQDRVESPPGAWQEPQMAQDQAVTQRGNSHVDWLAVFDAHGVQYLLLDTRHDGRLLQAVRSHPQWTVECVDEDSVLYSRKLGGAQARHDMRT
jgi:hypothetical protein